LGFGHRVTDIAGLRALLHPNQTFSSSSLMPVV
jgi:hypothetical protein